MKPAPRMERGHSRVAALAVGIGALSTPAGERVS